MGSRPILPEFQSITIDTMLQLIGVCVGMCEQAYSLYT